MSVNGAPIDYSYSLSGSTIELTDLASTRQSTRPSSQISSAFKVDAIPPPCHPVNRWFGSSQDCDIISEPCFCYHRSRMDFGSGSILVVSFGASVVYNNLCWVSSQLLGAYETTSNRYFTWLFNYDCLEYTWAFLEKFPGFIYPPVLYF